MEEETDMVMAAYKSMAVDSTALSFDSSPAPFDQGGERKNVRMGKNGGMGEIIQVEGGQIVRSTGKKDRHSKVVTAKGLRDRRVRLSALTAIHFYDVQDRLGCDRPSKAVDWLLQKAQPSIDKLPKKNPNHNNNSITISSPPKRIKSQSPTPQPAITPSEQQIHQEIPHEQNQYVPGQYPSIMSTFQIPEAMMNMPFQNPNVLQYFSSMNYQQNQSYTDNAPPPGSIPGGGGGGEDSNGNTRQGQVLGNMFCRSSSSSMVPPSAFTEEGNRHAFKWYNNGSSDTDNYDDDDDIKNNANANAYEIRRALAQQAQQPHPSSFRGGHGGFHSTTTKETLQSSSAPAFLADPSHHNVDLSAANCNNNTNNSYSYGFCGFRIPARIQGIEEDEHHEKTKHPSGASSSSQHHRFY